MARGLNTILFLLIVCSYDIQEATWGRGGGVAGWTLKSLLFLQH